MNKDIILTNEQILHKRWTGKTLGRYRTTYMAQLMAAEQDPKKEDLRKLDTIAAVASTLTEAQKLDYGLYASIPEWINVVGLQARWQMEILNNSIDTLTIAAGSIYTAAKFKHIVNLAREELPGHNVLFLEDKLQLKLTELKISDWWDDEQKRKEKMLQAWSWLQAHNYVMDLISKTLNIDITPIKEEFSTFFKYKAILDAKVIKLKALAEQLHLPYEQELKQQILDACTNIFTLNLELKPYTKNQDREALRRIRNFTAFHQGGELQRIYSEGGFKTYVIN